MLTRFEKARIMGARALQISMGAPILVKLPKSVTDLVDIIEEEFNAGVLPLTVIREMPDGEKIFVDISKK